MDELDEKPNHTKMSKFQNFERKGCKGKDSFFLPFDKKYIINGCKMFSFKCKSHVQEIILPKNMFGCHLNSFWDFLHFWLQNKIFIHNYVGVSKLTIVT
jgi:hypothetical protein